MRFTKFLAVAGIATFTLAACGGSTTTPTAVPTPTAALTAGPTATPAPSTAPSTAATGTPAATGSMADLCSLLTATDVHNVLGGGWTEGVMANDYCHWDSNAAEQLAVYYQAGDLATFKSGAPGGTDMDVSGHQGYSIASTGQHIFSVWVDIGGGQLLTIEFPTSSDADADQVNGQALAEIAVGNL